MLKLILFAGIFFTLIKITTSTYTCNCYCPDSYTYVGISYSSTCSNSACQSACYYAYSSCTSYTYTYGTCTGGSSNTWVNSYKRVLGVGTIVGIVIGSLTGLCILITIILIIIHLQKRKRRQIWALQAQQQQHYMNQRNFVTGPIQQWQPNAYHQPYVGLPIYSSYQQPQV